MLYELDCRYDSRNSFYGKAQVQESEYLGNKVITLFSYSTRVADIIYHNDKVEYHCYGKYSSTTTRHQKEFFKQFGLTEKEIKELFEKGVLEV